MDRHILMFGWELPPHNSGGLGVACHNLAKELSRKGLKITFVLPKKVEVDSEFMDVLFASESALDVKRIDTPISPYMSKNEYESALANSESSDNYGDSLVEEAKRYARKAGEIAKGLDFDVIHAHDWLCFGAGSVAKKETGKPFLAHVHATAYDRSGGNGRNEAVYQMEKQGFKNADKIISVSNFTKNKVVENYGVESEKIKPIHNGVNLENYDFKISESFKKLKDQDYNIVSFVGRITLQKGPEYFVEAASKVLEKEPKTLFVVAGSGDMEEQMIRQVADLGIGDNVLFAGFVRGKDLHSLYKSSDIFVMPSVSEPFGLTPLESIANDTPVIISKQSGVSEVLDHALKVDFWDTKKMANYILTAINHPALLDTLLSHSKNEIEDISWSDTAEKCLGVYKEVLELN